MPDRCTLLVVVSCESPEGRPEQMISAGIFMSAAIVSLHICALHACSCRVGVAVCGPDCKILFGLPHLLKIVFLLCFACGWPSASLTQGSLGEQKASGGALGSLELKAEKSRWNTASAGVASALHSAIRLPPPFCCLHLQGLYLLPAAIYTVLKSGYSFN